MTDTDLPKDLYIAAYDDAAAAEQDWDDLKQLAHDKVISIEAMALVRRDQDGKIHVKDSDTAADIGVGAATGAVAGAIIGIIFPPALLASAVVGAGVGAGGGAAFDLVTKHQIRSDVENTLPPNSSAVVAIFEERWVAEVEKALAKATKTEKHHVHDTSAESDPA
jgi:uncharacterized membrane protein